MGFADVQEIVHALFQPFCVVVPDHAAEEDAHRVEAQFLGPSQFLVDLGVVVGVGAPHFNLVDGCGRDIVATRLPALFRIPGGCLFRCPPRGGNDGLLSQVATGDQQRSGRKNHE